MALATATSRHGTEAALEQGDFQRVGMNFSKSSGL